MKIISTTSGGGFNQTKYYCEMCNGKIQIYDQPESEMVIKIRSLELMIEGQKQAISDLDAKLEIPHIEDKIQIEDIAPVKFELMSDTEIGKPRCQKIHISKILGNKTQCTLESNHENLEPCCYG